MISKFISLNGLKLYLLYILVVLSIYIYLQSNGIQLYNSTNTEHEGNSKTYGSSHHK